MVPLLETSILLILVMIAMSAFFSGSETALTAANRSRIHHLEIEGNRRAIIVSRLMGDREHLIGAILLGNNLVNIFASTLAGYAFSQTFGGAGIVYATIVMTALVVVFAEVLPKTLAIRKPEVFALAIAPPMSVMVKILAPITSAVQWLVFLILRMLGQRLGDDEGPSEQEIRGALALYKHEGGLVKDEHDMLDSILDLSQVEVGEVMTHRRSLVTVDVDAPIDEVIDEILASPYTRIPLWRDEPDNIIGVLHAKNLLRELRRSKGLTEGLSIIDMAGEPWFVPDATSLSEQLTNFRARHAHFALVVDEYGTLMGVVTMEDILEEIVGEIEDEYDEDSQDMAVSEDGSVTVDGTATIRDLNREFDWNLPDEEANTIAGLVIHEARQIPDIGQTFVFYDFRFEVTGRQRNQITALRVTPLKDSDTIESNNAYTST